MIMPLALPPNTSNADNTTERKLYRKITRLVAVFLAVVTVIGALIGWFGFGMPGLWAALIGAGLTALFCGSTLWSITHSIGASSISMAATVMLTWLLKLVVLIVVLLILRGRTFYNPYVLFAVIAVGVIGALVVQALALNKAKLPYITPAK